jgi:hypothetical protein
MPRLQELREFAETWLGRELTPADGVTVPASQEMPAALREIYQTLGSVGQFTKPHNELLDPSCIVSDGGYRIFYDENQLVVRWAFRDTDRDKDDPVVFQGTTLEDGYEWFSEEMSISAWFRVMTLWQLVNGGYEFGAYSSGIPGATEIVESSYPRVGGHADGSTRFYGTAGQLICLEGSALVPSVWAAGASADGLAALSSTLGFEWDYSSADE